MEEGKGGGGRKGRGQGNGKREEGAWNFGKEVKTKYPAMILENIYLFF